MFAIKLDLLLKCGKQVFSVQKLDAHVNFPPFIYLIHIRVLIKLMAY